MRLQNIRFMLGTIISAYFIIGCGSSYKFTRLIESEESVAITNAKVKVTDTENKENTYVDSINSDGFVEIDDIDRPIVFVEIYAPGFEPYRKEYDLSTADKSEKYKPIRLAPAKTRIVGYVYDGSTEEPLENPLNNVTISNTFNEDKEEVTDRNGRYEIILKDYIASGEVTVNTLESGYEDASKTAVVTVNETNRFPPIRLSRTKAIKGKIDPYDNGKTSGSSGGGISTNEDQTEDPASNFINKLEEQGQTKFSKIEYVDYLLDMEMDDRAEV